MSERWTVVQSEHLSEAAARWLTERCELLVCRYDDPAFARALEHADGLVVRTYTLVNEELLSKSPRLKVVGRAGVGLDNIDVRACQRRGVQVVSTPDANTQAVVEYVVALMMDVFRPRLMVGEAVEGVVWNQLREETCGARQLNELTVGILGLGRIGKRIAAVMRAIGAEVIYHDVAEIAEALRHGARAVSLEELFAKSDVLTIHVDGRATNRHFLNAERIAQLRSNVVVINTSRGFVIDPVAMAAFLSEHPQATAVLDVHEPEPFDAGYPLLGLANARLYPHLASRTETAMNNMSWVVRDVAAVLQGRRPAFGAW